MEVKTEVDTYYTAEVKNEGSSEKMENEKKGLMKMAKKGVEFVDERYIIKEITKKEDENLCETSSEKQANKEIDAETQAFTVKRETDLDSASNFETETIDKIKTEIRKKIKDEGETVVKKEIDTSREIQDETEFEKQVKIESNVEERNKVGGGNEVKEEIDTAKKMQNDTEFEKEIKPSIENQNEIEEKTDVERGNPIGIDKRIKKENETEFGIDPEGKPLDKDTFGRIEEIDEKVKVENITRINTLDGKYDTEISDKEIERSIEMKKETSENKAEELDKGLNKENIEGVEAVIKKEIKGEIEAEYGVVPSCSKIYVKTEERKTERGTKRKIERGLEEPKKQVVEWIILSDDDEPTVSGEYAYDKEVKKKVNTSKQMQDNTYLGKEVLIEIEPNIRKQNKKREKTDIEKKLEEEFATKLAEENEEAFSLNRKVVFGREEMESEFVRYDIASFKLFDKKVQRSIETEIKSKVEEVKRGLNIENMKVGAVNRNRIKEKVGTDYGVVPSTSGINYRRKGKIIERKIEKGTKRALETQVKEEPKRQVVEFIISSDDDDDDQLVVIGEYKYDTEAEEKIYTAKKMQDDAEKKVVTKIELSIGIPSGVENKSEKGVVTELAIDSEGDKETAESRGRNNKVVFKREEIERKFAIENVSRVGTKKCNTAICELSKKVIEIPIKTEMETEVKGKVEEFETEKVKKEQKGQVVELIDSSDDEPAVTAEYDKEFEEEYLAWYNKHVETGFLKVPSMMEQHMDLRALAHSLDMMVKYKVTSWHNVHEGEIVISDSDDEQADDKKD